MNRFFKEVKGNGDRERASVVPAERLELPT